MRPVTLRIPNELMELRLKNFDRIVTLYWAASRMKDTAAARSMVQSLAREFPLCWRDHADAFNYLLPTAVYEWYEYQWCHPCFWPLPTDTPDS